MLYENYFHIERHDKYLQYLLSFYLKNVKQLQSSLKQSQCYASPRINCQSINLGILTQFFGKLVPYWMLATSKHSGKEHNGARLDKSALWEACSELCWNEKKGHPEEKSWEKHLDTTSLPSLQGADSSLWFIALHSSWVNLAAYIPEQWHRNLGHPLMSSVWELFIKTHRSVCSKNPSHLIFPQYHQYFAMHFGILLPTSFIKHC